MKVNKKLGQHFIVKRKSYIIEYYLKRHLHYTKNVIEIGPGKGALTKLLLKQLSTGNLLMIEKDFRLYKKILSQRLKVINKDILDFKEDFFKDKVIVGSLPYNVTKDIMMKIIKGRAKYAWLIMQKEVADLYLNPGNKWYCFLNTYYKSQRIRNLNIDFWWPRPKVKGTILTLTLKSEQVKGFEDYERYISFLNEVWRYPRKLI